MYYTKKAEREPGISPHLYIVFVHILSLQVADRVTVLTVTALDTVQYKHREYLNGQWPQ